MPVTGPLPTVPANRQTLLPAHPVGAAPLDVSNVHLPLHTAVPPFVFTQAPVSALHVGALGDGVHPRLTQMGERLMASAPNASELHFSPGPVHWASLVHAFPVV